MGADCVYTLSMRLPAAIWTDPSATPRKTRTKLRQQATGQWREAIRREPPFPLDTYSLVVKTPPTVPALAAIPAKPLIDAGTDAGVWFDDDSLHRVCTRYEQALNVSDSRLDMHASPCDAPILPISAPACTVGFRLAPGDWINGNNPPSALQDALDRLRIRARAWWETQAYMPVSGMYEAVAAIAYPGKTGRADPDNAAQTVQALLDAGADIGALPSSRRACHAVTFLRAPNVPHPYDHYAYLSIYPFSRQKGHDQ